MMRHILVPTDFSPCSANALRYAAQLAYRMNAAKITILHCYTAPLTYHDLGLTPAAGQAILERDQEVQHQFKKLIDNTPELKEIETATLTQQALLVDAILSLCMTAHIDLVVMGTEGAEGIDELIVGTHTYDVIKDTKCPVLVVPEHSTYEKPQRIALASDFKNTKPKLLQPLLDLNRLFGSTIHIVHITEDEQLVAKKANEAKKFEQYFKDVPHEYHYLREENVEEALVEYCESHNINMLVLIPRKHPLFDRIFGEGESKSIIFHTAIPLLVISE